MAERAIPFLFHLPFLHSRLLAFKPVHLRAFEFPVGVARFHVFALVILRFAFAHGERDFHPAVFPVK
jgi:hypothetical protein